MNVFDTEEDIMSLDDQLEENNIDYLKNNYKFYIELDIYNHNINIDNFILKIKQHLNHSYIDNYYVEHKDISMFHCIHIYSDSFFENDKDAYRFISFLEKHGDFINFMVPSVSVDNLNYHYHKYIPLTGKQIINNDFKTLLYTTCLEQKKRRNRTLDLRNLDISGQSTIDFNWVDKDGISNAFDAINITGWDTSNLRYLSFKRMSSIKKIIGIEDIDTSNIHDMSNMFEYCKSLESLDLSKWKVNNVYDMSYMFNTCEKLKSIDFSGWNTNNLTKCRDMFYNCYELSNLDINHFKVHKVQLFNDMFSRTNITEIDLSNWNTKNALSFTMMFYRCDKLKIANLSNWNTSKLKSTASMFEYCPSLKEIIGLTEWDISNIENSSFMFKECVNLKDPDLSTWDIRKYYPDMTDMYKNCQFKY